MGKVIYAKFENSKKEKKKRYSKCLIYTKMIKDIILTLTNRSMHCKDSKKYIQDNYEYIKELSYIVNRYFKKNLKYLYRNEATKKFPAELLTYGVTNFQEAEKYLFCAAKFFLKIDTSLQRWNEEYSKKYKLVFFTIWISVLIGITIGISSLSGFKYNLAVIIDFLVLFSGIICINFYLAYDELRILSDSKMKKYIQKLKKEFCQKSSNIQVKSHNFT
ncbi:hypothetical protein ACFIJ5_14840 [Haloimpatiens sp. FM7330]|uniref:hypothetical protein n=1 Tax=Haloimpatiens sp. FM7330 TaxID=3298610 RepID=UPI00362B44A2